jgi:hypothetical protein
MFPSFVQKKMVISSWATTGRVAASQFGMSSLEKEKVRMVLNVYYDLIYVRPSYIFWLEEKSIWGHNSW